MKLRKIIPLIRTFLKSKRVLSIAPASILGITLIYFISMKAEGLQKKISENQGDTIKFSGYNWVTKESNDRRTGPGNNLFSGTRENVYVDSTGKLHLRLTNRNDKWYCPEVRMVDGLGYGRYYFYLEPLPHQMDKDIVVGMFFYDREDSSNFHKEIDIEISQWGKDSSLNTQYVIQPKESEAIRFKTDLLLPTKHVIEVRRKRVMFKSYYDAVGPEDIPLQITNCTIKPDYEYQTNNERVSINVWLYHTSEPSNLKEFEIVFSKFEYKPFWFDNFIHRNRKTINK